MTTVYTRPSSAARRRRPRTTVLSRVSLKPIKTRAAECAVSALHVCLALSICLSTSEQHTHTFASSCKGHMLVSIFMGATAQRLSACMSLMPQHWGIKEQDTWMLRKVKIKVCDVLKMIRHLVCTALWSSMRRKTCDHVTCREVCCQARAKVVIREVLAVCLWSFLARCPEWAVSRSTNSVSLGKSPLRTIHKSCVPTVICPTLVQPESGCTRPDISMIAGM